MSGRTMLHLGLTILVLTASRSCPAQAPGVTRYRGVDIFRASRACPWRRSEAAVDASGGITTEGEACRWRR